MEKTVYIIEYIQQNRNQLVADWMESFLSSDKQKGSVNISKQTYVNLFNEYLNIVIQFSQNPNDKTRIIEFTQKMIQLGWTLAFIMDMINEFGELLFMRMVQEAPEKDQMEFVWDFSRTVAPINNQLFDQYASSWQKTVSLQKVALQELSAPLIPIFDNISVMPLVGTIDTERAKAIMENLLQGVVKHRAQVVLIDITGVPVVDTMVAHHIIQASEAVRLVGATCLIVGIRPEIAQTIVNLGIDLSQVITKSSLQKGITAALEMTNRKIITTEE